MNPKDMLIAELKKRVAELEAVTANRDSRLRQALVEYDAVRARWIREQLADLRARANEGSDT